MSGTKLNPQQVAYAGEHFVAAEIHRQGGYAVTFSGNMKGIDLLASDAAHERKIDIQVKTKTAGAWQTSVLRGQERDEPDDERSFWVLVDLRPDSPEYYIVPTWWIQNDIHSAHKEYLAKRGGHRAKNDSSTHHSIPPSRVQQWKNRWDILGIFPAPAL